MDKKVIHRIETFSSILIAKSMIHGPLTSISTCFNYSSTLSVLHVSWHPLLPSFSLWLTGNRHATMAVWLHEGNCHGDVHRISLLILQWHDIPWGCRVRLWYCVLYITNLLFFFVMYSRNILVDFHNFSLSSLDGLHWCNYIGVDKIPCSDLTILIMKCYLKWLYANSLVIERKIWRLIKHLLGGGGFSYSKLQ